MARLSSSFSASSASILRLSSRTRSLRGPLIERTGEDTEGLGDKDIVRMLGVDAPGVLGGVTGGLNSLRRAFGVPRKGPVTLPDELVLCRRLAGAPGGVILGV